MCDEKHKNKSLQRPRISKSDQYELVHGADVPRRLRFVLTEIKRRQGGNAYAWCTRETFADAIGIAVSTFSNKTKALDDLGVIHRQWIQMNGRQTRVYAINFDKLKECQRCNSSYRGPAQAAGLASQKPEHPLPQTAAPPLVSQSAKHTSNIQVTETLSERNGLDSGDKSLAEDLWGISRALSPNRPQPSMKRWTQQVATLKRNGRDSSEIKRLYRWASEDAFWRSRVMEPGKLASYWDMLELKARELGTNGTAKLFDADAALDGILAISKTVSQSEPIKHLVTQQYGEQAALVFKELGRTKFLTVTEYNRGKLKREFHALWLGAGS